MPEPTFTEAEGIQKITSDQSTISVNAVTEEKYLSTPQNGSDQNLVDGEKHDDHANQNHAFNDECRSPVKSECSMNGDTEEQHHSTETTVWIRCDVYDTGIGIPGIYSYYVVNLIFSLFIHKLNNLYSSVCFRILFCIYKFG